MVNFKTILVFGTFFLFILSMYFAVSYAYPPLAHSVVLGTSVAQNINLQIPLENGAQAQEVQAYNQSLQSVQNTATGINWLPYGFMIISIVVFLILALNVKAHPSMIVLWFIFIGVACVMAIIYSQNLEPTTTSEYYNEQSPLTELFNDNLVYIIAIFGLLGAVIMFNLIRTEPEFQELTV